MAGKLTIADVEKTAKLANLPLSQKKIKKLSTQVASILDYMDQIQKVDTTGVEEVSNVNDSINVTREDIVENERMFSQDEALANAKEKYQGFFVVKAVFEE